MAPLTDLPDHEVQIEYSAPKFNQNSNHLVQTSNGFQILGIIGRKKHSMGRKIIMLIWGSV
jgi:hypothetical protein